MRTACRFPPYDLRRLLVLPKRLESIDCQLGISHRVLNIPMAEIMLDRPRIVPFICELESAGVTQHVRVYGKVELSALTSASDDLPNRRIRHRSTPLGREDVRAHRIIAPKSSQRSYLRSAKRMRRCHPVL